MRTDTFTESEKAGLIALRARGEWLAGPYEAEARRERDHPLAPIRGLLAALVLGLCFWGLVALVVALKVWNR